MMRRSSPFRHQWGLPIGLALLTLFGLLCALLGEGGLWWWVSWAALAIPLLVLARQLLFAAPPGDLPHARHRAS